MSARGAHRRASSGRRAGITLVETLATLVLLGIVLPAVMGAISLSLRAASAARHRSEAALLGEAKLNEALALQDESLVTGTGNFGDDWPEYAWEGAATVGDFNVMQLDLTITWTERGQERDLTLTTFLYPAGVTAGTTTGGF